MTRYSKPHTHSDWSDDRIAELKRLWALGFSCSQIARQIGGVTRNSVIGKAHRLGLDRRKAGTRSDISVRPRARSARIVATTSSMPPIGEPKAPRPVTATEVIQTNAFAAIYGLPQAVLERDAHQCGHPLGDGDQFHYCTNERAPGKHYCAGHHAACWTKPKRNAESVVRVKAQAIAA